jgi:hypothetical protein
VNGQFVASAALSSEKAPPVATEWESKWMLDSGTDFDFAVFLFRVKSAER